MGIHLILIKRQIAVCAMCGGRCESARELDIPSFQKEGLVDGCFRMVRVLGVRFMRAPFFRNNGPFCRVDMRRNSSLTKRFCLHVVPTFVSSSFDGQCPSSSVSEGGLAATVKETISKLMDVVGSLLGGKGSKNGGAAGGGTKAKKKSSKRKSNSSSGGFTKSFEAKYGKR